MDTPNYLGDDKIENRKEINPQEQSINAYVHERIPDCPPISFKVLLGYHGTKRDAEVLDLKKNIQECDLFAPEFFVEGDTLEDLSQGKITPDEVLKKIPRLKFEGFAREMMDTIYDSGKSVFVSDLNLFTEKYGKILAEKARDGISVNPGRMSPEEYRTEFVKFCDDFVKSQNKREKIWLERMGESIVREIKKKPQIVYAEGIPVRKKESIKVLVFAGMAHLRIYHMLKRGEDAPVSAQFSSNYFPQEAEFFMRLVFDKEISFELVTQSVTSIICNYDLATDQYLNLISGGDENKKSLLKRYIFSWVINDDYEPIFNAYKLKRNPFKKLVEILKSRNVLLPESPESFNKMIEEGIIRT